MRENMDYELVDLIDIKELKKLTDNWTRLIGLPMGTFDPYGKALLGSGWRVRGKAGATELLGLKPTTLDARMKKLKIRRPK